MNFKSACAFLLMFATLPCVDNYAGVIKEHKNKRRLEFLAKGKHNFEFNISLGHNFSRATYDTGLNAKIFSANGEIFLYDPNDEKTLYTLPTLSTPSSPVLPSYAPKINGESLSIFDEDNFHRLLDLKTGLSMKFCGSSIPAQLDFNYIYNRRLKIGISGQFNLGYYYCITSNLGEELANYKQDTKTTIPILVERFKQHYLKKKLSVDYRAYLNLGVRCFDYNPYSFWVYMQNGFSWKEGDKFLPKESLISGYSGNIYVSLEKYLSKHIKMFWNLGSGLNIYKNSKAFDESGKNVWKVYDWSIINFSFGFSFGSNDGRYEDYIYQKAEYDFFIDKYLRMFDYYEEYFPEPDGI